MSKLLLAIIMLTLYIILGSILAVYSRKRAKGGLEDFYVGGRRLGGFLSAMTYAATTYSSFMIVGLVGLSYFTGVGSLGFELVYLVGTLGLLVIFAPRAWRLAKERGWITPSQMLADTFDSPLLGAFIAALYLLALLPYASGQVKGIGETFAGLAGQDYYWAGVLFALLVMVVWSTIAGIWSVAITDALQGLWMIFSATLLLLWIIIELVGSGIGVNEVNEVLITTEIGTVGGKYWSLPVFIAFTIPWLFFAATNPQVVQRLYMPKDESSLRNMVRWFGVFGLYYTILVTLIGILARVGVETGVFAIAPEGRDQVTPLLLSITHPLLAAMVFTSIVAASVSTADSILLTLSSTTLYDLIREGRNRELSARITIIIVAILMTAIALQRTSTIVDLSVLSSLILLSLAPPTIIAWLGLKGDPRLGFLAVASGPLLVLVQLIRLDWNARAVLASQVLGIPVSIVILLLSTILTILGVQVAKRLHGTR